MMSGVGGNSGYACKAPEGVLCTSVAGVYANAIQNNLPSQRVGKRPADLVTKPAATVRKTTPIPGQATEPASASATNPTSIRSAPRILRAWIAPWEDSDGDLQDQSFVYVVVDSGRWLIEHRRAAIQNEFMQIKAPSAALPEPSDASKVSDPDPMPLRLSNGTSFPGVARPASGPSEEDAE